LCTVLFTSRRILYCTALYSTVLNLSLHCCLRLQYLDEIAQKFYGVRKQQGGFLGNLMQVRLSRQGGNSPS